MCITKTSMICFLLIVLAASLSNYNVLASEIKPRAKVAKCNNLCSESYGDSECVKDCAKSGFEYGQCLSPPPSHSSPKRCCCIS
ncbi:unnamed protein product [Cochlearia groenlandica]